MILSTSEPLSEHMGPMCVCVWGGVWTWCEHIVALPCHNTLGHCGTCKDVRGVLIMHTYESEMSPPYSVWMASVMLRDTTYKLKVMYTEMTARLIVH